MLEKAWLSIGRWLAAYVVIHAVLWGVRRLILKIWVKRDE